MVPKRPTSASSAACDLGDPEGILEDDAENLRYQVDVPDDDEQGDQQVADGHDRYDDAAYFGDAVDAAEDDDQRNDRQDKAYHQRVEAESDIEGAADGVALNGVVRQAESHGNQDGEKCRQPGLLESLEDIVGRSADKMMLFPSLEKLRERRFDEGRGGAQQCDDPHPEYGAGAADGDSSSYAGQVAGAYARCHTDGEGLERGNMLLPVVLSGGIAQQPEHLADHAELYAPRAEREVERAADKHGDEDVCPQEIIGSGYLPAQPTVGGKQIFHR